MISPGSRLQNSSFWVEETARETLSAGRGKLFHVADEKTENLGDLPKGTHLLRTSI